jgi:hypothetical protein
MVLSHFQRDPHSDELTLGVCNMLLACVPFGNRAKFVHAVLGNVQYRLFVLLSPFFRSAPCVSRIPRCSDLTRPSFPNSRMNRDWPQNAVELHAILSIRKMALPRVFFPRSFLREILYCTNGFTTGVFLVAFYEQYCTV